MPPTRSGHDAGHGDCAAGYVSAAGGPAAPAGYPGIFPSYLKVMCPLISPILSMPSGTRRHCSLYSLFYHERSILFKTHTETTVKTDTLKCIIPVIRIHQMKAITSNDKIYLREKVKALTKQNPTIREKRLRYYGVMCRIPGKCRNMRIPANIENFAVAYRVNFKRKKLKMDGVDHISKCQK